MIIYYNSIETWNMHHFFSISRKWFKFCHKHCFHLIFVSILFRFILFRFILFYFILFYFILFRKNFQFHSDLFCDYDKGCTYPYSFDLIDITSPLFSSLLFPSFVCSIYMSLIPFLLILHIILLTAFLLSTSFCCLKIYSILTAILLIYSWW